MPSGLFEEVERVPEGSSGPTSLAALLASEDIAWSFAHVAEAATLVQLSMCSAKLQDVLTDKLLWSSILGARRADAKPTDDPQREYARLSIQETFDRKPDFREATKIAMPKRPRASPPRPAWAEQVQTVSRSWNASIGSDTIVKPAPLRARRALSGIVPQQSILPDADALPRETMSACAVARLREGLKALVLGGHEGITACPEQPSDWSVWRARLSIASDGSLMSGLKFELRLCFPVGSDATRAQNGLPLVKVEAPAHLFHPNLDPAGVLCSAALESRCSAVDLVGDQLSAVMSILQRPVFRVPPRNLEAAAAWYGDKLELRRRVRGALDCREPPICLSATM